jgi:hypothetical protein
MTGAQDDSRFSPKLEGWDAIAAYLGVAKRTAQEYEKKLGMPVLRLNGQSKSRVQAAPEELDKWQSRLVISTPTEASTGPQATQRLGSSAQANGGEAKIGRAGARNAIAAGAILLLASVGAYRFLSPRGPVADIAVRGNLLLGKNANGDELWRFAFPGLLADSAYLQEGRLRRTWIGDVTGRSSPGILFVAVPLSKNEVGRLYCFDSRGKRLWDFTPGDHPVVDGSGELLLPPYNSTSLHVFPAEKVSDGRIVLTSLHHLEQPTQVAALGYDGRLIGEYWHPGHLPYSAQADLDRDGREELLLAGVNNGNHAATLVVLDVRGIVGQVSPTEMNDIQYGIRGMAPARQKRVVFFPRSCIARGQPYNRAAALRITKDRILVTVAEGISETAGPDVVYQLDYEFKVTSVVPGNLDFMERHRKLEAEGKIDHHYSGPQEFERLKQAVVVRTFK